MTVLARILLSIAALIFNSVSIVCTRFRVIYDDMLNEVRNVYSVFFYHQCRLNYRIKLDTGLVLELSDE